MLYYKNQFRVLLNFYKFLQGGDFIEQLINVFFTLFIIQLFFSLYSFYTFFDIKIFHNQQGSKLKLKKFLNN